MAPAGSRWVSAERARVEFVVPQAWKSYDLRRLLDEADASRIAEVTKAMNVTKDQLTQLAQTVDVFVMDPTPSSFRANIQAMLSPMTSLPTTARVRSEFGGVGLRVSATKRVRTPAGTALVVTYDGTTSQRVIHGRSILVGTGDGVTDITVIADRASTVATVTSPLLHSLRLTTG